MQSRSLGLSLRFILPLVLAFVAFGYIVVPLMDNLTLRWFVRDLDIRSQLLASALHEPLQDYVRLQSRSRINLLFDRAIRDERLYALGFCDTNNKLLYRPNTYPASLGCGDVASGEGVRKSLVQFPQGPVHVSTSTIGQDGKNLGKLILVHDMSFIERRSADTKKYAISFFALLAVVVSLITVVIAHLSWRGWISGVKSILRGDLLPRSAGNATPEMQPLLDDLRALLQEYHADRRRADTTSELWTPDKLKALLQNDLAGDQVLVVSNREPYIHPLRPGQHSTSIATSNHRFDFLRNGSTSASPATPMYRLCCAPSTMSMKFSNVTIAPRMCAW